MITKRRFRRQITKAVAVPEDALAMLREIDSIIDKRIPNYFLGCGRSKTQSIREYIDFLRQTVDDLWMKHGAKGVYRDKHGNATSWDFRHHPVGSLPQSPRKKSKAEK